MTMHTLDTHSTQQEPRARRMIKTWWASVKSDSQRYFDMSSDFDILKPTFALTQLLIDLEMLYSDIESVAYPEIAAEARRHLLNAMATLWQGFADALDGDMVDFNERLRRAEAHMALFNAELRKYGAQP